jgi:hypothetical protein
MVRRASQIAAETGAFWTEGIGSWPPLLRPEDFDDVVRVLSYLHKAGA